MTLLRERSRMWLKAHSGVMFQNYETTEPVYLASKLIKTLDAIETIRDSDPDAYRAIMREMGDGE